MVLHLDENYLPPKQNIKKKNIKFILLTTKKWEQGVELSIE